MILIALQLAEDSVHHFFQFVNVVLHLHNLLHYRLKLAGINISANRCWKLREAQIG